MGQDESAPSLPRETGRLSIGRLKLTKIPFFIPSDHPVTKIDASHNTLRMFPTRLDNLETLDLTDNSLSLLEEEKFFDEADFNFQSLKKLRLSSNKLTKLPLSMSNSSNFPVLVDLSLDRNEFSQFNFSLPNIISLDLFLNSFSEFPDLPASVKMVNIGFNQIKSLSVYLTNLIELRLPGNDLTEITANCKFDSVTFLDLSFNRLVSLPPIKDFAPKVETISLSFNFLSQFPSDFPLTTKKIDLAHNCMSEWSDSLSQLSGLISLDVSFNHFTNIPNLPLKIEKFNADHNYLTSSVPLLAVGVKGLQLNHNNFKDIPSFNDAKVTHLLMRKNQLESIQTAAISHDIRSIDFTCNLIRELPIELFNFQSLTTLMLTKNSITSIPAEIENSQIQTLMISDNPINSLPYLPESLKEIIACNCELTELPECLFNLPAIQLINFNCNKIAKIEKFPEVETLYLSQNCLTKIPPLPEFISSVDLSHNNLMEFTFDGDLPFLQLLDLSHNSLTKLHLRPLPSLQVLKISHNKVSFKMDLTMFPKLDTVDLHQTDVKHSMPVPLTIREIITNDIKTLKSNSTQLKFFNGKRCGYCETIGRRPTMEDSLIIWESSKPKTPSLYGVIDGHGGFRTSAISASLIPSFFDKLETKSISGISKVFKQVNSKLAKMEVTDGATVVLAMVTPSLVSVAHLGDARALVVRNDGSIYPLTFDHKPTERSELDVLKETRAFVASGRLSSHLAVSRALGDFLIDGVSRMPDLSTYKITDNDSWLVLACDGVFDVLENEEVGEIVSKCGDIHKAAATVKNEAIIRGSMDNVSVIVVDITKQKK
ncbi:protein phosphatase 2C [Tritrichomonas foetus]|uniref:Protein phosphatase 2C n=1 Tax=Tritrichomonas foetus TaxID=1144522 RepID=A0A1J4KKM7_9EUKA|nr:protein phosphatase 2C [Tritrichomonas foetus]|eukprot:OHT11488.1 protein phosphatase 2C [Tritrichomonas foetus]